MNRRLFLRRAAIAAAGVVAAEELELLDRLGWVRTLFAGAAIGPPPPTTITVAQPYRIIEHSYGVIQTSEVFVSRATLAAIYDEPPERQRQLLAQLMTPPPRLYHVFAGITDPADVFPSIGASSHGVGG